MAAFGRTVPQEKRSLIFGVATAASSFGQFAFAPISQGFINAFGWQSALLYLAMALLLIIPLSYRPARPHREHHRPGRPALHGGAGARPGAMAPIACW